MVRAIYIPTMESIGQRIKARRKELSLTQQQVADAFGINRVSVTQWEKDDTAPDRDKIADLAALLECDANWLLAGTGRAPSGAKSPLVGSYDPDAPPSPEFDADWDGIKGAGVIDGRLSYDATLEGGMPEVAATPGLGHGTIDDGRAAQLNTGGIATGHPVLNEWVIPPSYVRSALDASPGQIMIMPVIGHSMEPVLKSNDRVMVDISQNVWVGDAVYVIDDGDTVLRAKTIKKVTSSNPPRYRIISEASPEDVEILGLDQFKIVGRVVGRFTRM